MNEFNLDKILSTMSVKDYSQSLHSYYESLSENAIRIQDTIASAIVESNKTFQQLKSDSGLNQDNDYLLSITNDYTTTLNNVLDAVKNNVSTTVDLNDIQIEGINDSNTQFMSLGNVLSGYTENIDEYNVLSSALEYLGSTDTPNTSEVNNFILSKFNGAHSTDSFQQIVKSFVQNLSNPKAILSSILSILNIDLEEHGNGWNFKYSSLDYSGKSGFLLFTSKVGQITIDTVFGAGVLVKKMLNVIFLPQKLINKAVYWLGSKLISKVQDLNDDIYVTSDAIENRILEVPIIQSFATIQDILDKQYYWTTIDSDGSSRLSLDSFYNNLVKINILPSNLDYRNDVEDYTIALNAFKSIFPDLGFITYNLGIGSVKLGIDTSSYPAVLQYEVYIAIDRNYYSIPNQGYTENPSHVANYDETTGEGQYNNFFSFNSDSILINDFLNSAADNINKYGSKIRLRENAVLRNISDNYEILKSLIRATSCGNFPDLLQSICESSFETTLIDDGYKYMPAIGYNFVDTLMLKDGNIININQENHFRRKYNENPSTNPTNAQWMNDILVQRGHVYMDCPTISNGHYDDYLNDIVLPLLQRLFSYTLRYSTVSGLGNDATFIPYVPNGSIPSGYGIYTDSGNSKKWQNFLIPIFAVAALTVITLGVLRVRRKLKYSYITSNAKLEHYSRLIGSGTITDPNDIDALLNMSYLEQRKQRMLRFLIGSSGDAGLASISGISLGSDNGSTQMGNKIIKLIK